MAEWTTIGSGEKSEFAKWLRETYGNDIADEFIREIQSKKINRWPPNRGALGGFFTSQMSWKYDWEKLYNQYKNPTSPENAPVQTYTLNKETSPWEQLGMDEEAFATQYPDLYKQAKEYASTPTEEWELWGYPDEATYKKDQALADKLGITFQDLVAQMQGLKIPSSGVSADTQAQLDYQKQQDAYRYAIAATESENERFRALQSSSQARAAQFWNAMANKQGENVDYENAYEQARQEILSSLEPTDWVQKYLVTNKPNPYKKEGGIGSIQEQLSELKDQQKAYEDALKDMQKNVDDPERPDYMSEDTKQTMNFLKSTIQKLKDDQLNLRTGNLSEFAPFKQVMDLTGMSPLAAMQTSYRYSQNPESPEFADLSMEEKQALGNAGRSFQTIKRPEPTLDIPSFLQPVIGAGKTTKVTGLDTSKWPEAVTPSGQYWNRLNPTQKSLFGSYASAQGGANAPTDLFASMTMQLPKSLSFRKTWRV